MQPQYLMKYVWIVPGDHLNLGRSWDLHKLFLVKDVQKCSNTPVDIESHKANSSSTRSRALQLCLVQAHQTIPLPLRLRKTASRNSEVPWLSWDADHGWSSIRFGLAKWCDDVYCLARWKISGFPWTNSFPAFAFGSADALANARFFRFMPARLAVCAGNSSESRMTALHVFVYIGYTAIGQKSNYSSIL